MDDVRLKVVGTGSYLPERIVTNEEFEGQDFWKYDVEGNKIGEPIRITSDKIYEMSGIKERRYATEDETPSYMGTIAAIRAIEDSGVDPRNLVGIILATVSEDRNFPSGACNIQAGLEKEYGIRLENCTSYDIGASCAGSTFGMIKANQEAHFRKGNYLVVGSEDIARISEKDDMNRFLFGSGAGAMILKPSVDGSGIVGTYSQSETYEDRSSWISRDKRGYLRMPEGRKVFNEGVRKMVEGARKVKEEAGWDIADVYVLHQANLRMIEMVEKMYAPPETTVLKNIEKTGNMSSATCPIAVDYALKNGIIRSGSKVVITAFGSGLFSAAVAHQF